MVEGVRGLSSPRQTYAYVLQCSTSYSMYFVLAPKSSQVKTTSTQPSSTGGPSADFGMVIWVNDLYRAIVAASEVSHNVV